MDRPFFGLEWIGWEFPGAMSRKKQEQQQPRERQEEPTGVFFLSPVTAGIEVPTNSVAARQLWLFRVASLASLIPLTRLRSMRIRKRKVSF
jgi:hypothetical protein